MKMLRQGEAPDYRFTLANERTFLAWIRTALGFLVAGVALEQLPGNFPVPFIGEGLSILLVIVAGIIACHGYFRWLANERAMRLKQDLGYTSALKVLAILMVLMSIGYLFSVLNVN